MNFKENESPTKLRGGYYTPAPVARFLAKWVLARKPKTVLEPSCGDGEFVDAIRSLSRGRVSLTAVEIIPSEAAAAREKSRGSPSLEAEIFCGDFLEWSLEAMKGGKKFGAVLGNPPYIRYQYLDDRDQEFSAKIFELCGMAFTKHTNAWVPFIISSVCLLAEGGRLAMVVPSEILHVLHANSLRSFLLNQCSKILLIDPIELLFQEALQGTVLLLLEKKGAHETEECHIGITRMADNSFLEKNPEVIFKDADYVSSKRISGKWMRLFLTEDELQALDKICSSKNVRRFSDIATADVGIVTGANAFFLVNDETVEEYGLQDFARPMFGRSEHCPGILYDSVTHRRNKASGLAANFLMFGKTPFSKLPKGVQRYIKQGEAEGLPLRYKCRIRSPWYAVPSVYSAPIGMLKRSNHFPRLILNSAEALTTDTSYRIRAKVGGPDAPSMVYSFVNSLTALTAELEGRHYGGGVLELVPSEIDNLFVPIVRASADDVRRLDSAIRKGGDYDAILAEQDAHVLAAIGISEGFRTLLHQAWRRVRTRRHRHPDDVRHQ